MRRALRDLPPVLDAAFENVLTRIQMKGEEFQRLAFETFAWVLYASRPLTVEELLEALAVEEWSLEREPENIPMMELMLECCMGLVIVQPSDRTVRFSHYSVQEFLSSRSSLIPPALYLAKSSLTYLLFDKVV